MVQFQDFNSLSSLDMVMVFYLPLNIQALLQLLVKCFSVIFETIITLAIFFFIIYN